MAVNKIQASYGTWPSLITPVSLSQRLRLEDVLYGADGSTLTWLEGRSDRGILVQQSGAEARRDMLNQHSARGGVGYGGGAFTTGSGRLIFAEKDGRLYQSDLGGGEPRPITPPFGAAASPVVSPGGKWVLYVFSDGKSDLLALVDLEGNDWPLQLVRGADFYMQPAWHPSGNQIAWVEWNHPNMPWDGTSLKIGRMGGDPPRVTGERHIAGNSDQTAVQPLFSPDGNGLSFIESAGDWEQLTLVDLSTGTRRTLVQGEKFALAMPAWVQGSRSYGWSPDSRHIYYTRIVGGESSLWQLEVENGRNTRIDTGPYTWISQLCVSSTKDEVAFLASGPAVPERVVRWDGKALHVVARSEPENLPAEFFPVPQSLVWRNGDGDEVNGIFFPPTHPRFASSGLPPAIVSIHGGPTLHVQAVYKPETAYFTSRGWAVLEVNYRGSTGYGRAYQQAMRQRWGDVDVEDAASAARSLAELGLADGKRLVIKGGSAGGYTVLNTLIRYPGLFKAGVSLYGVSNLFALNLETHKFESHYNDSLVGTLPEAAGRFHAWSAVFHANRIRDPLAVFQGSIDRVVPPNQSESVVAALQKNGIPHLYRLYEGEGHGFRKPETLLDYYQQLEKFLLQHVIFAP